MAGLAALFLAPSLVAPGVLCFVLVLISAAALFAAALFAAALFAAALFAAALFAVVLDVSNTAFGVPPEAVSAVFVAHKDKARVGQLIVMWGKYTVGEVVIAGICELVELLLVGL